MKERIDKTIAKINQLIEEGKFSIFGQEYEDIIKEYGVNELMILGCKICKTPTGIRHLEIPYHGVSKRRLNNALNTLKMLEGEIEDGEQ